MYTISEHLLVDVPIQALDIGGTNTAAAQGGTAVQNHWVSMVNHGKLTIIGIIGTQTAGDSLLTITIQQATSSIGANVKTVKAFTIADGILDTTGQRFVVEVDASELDTANDFTHLRVLVAMTDNANTDSLTVVYLRSQARFAKLASDAYTLRLPKDQAPN
jgi:hypothetical protein